MSRPKRRRAWRFGRRAESLAAWWLRLKGYRILAREFRVPVGEIDLIARRGTILAFVEVKARKTAEAAPDALQPRQQRRIARAAGAFLRWRANACASTSYGLSPAGCRATYRMLGAPIRSIWHELPRDGAPPVHGEPV